MVKPPAARQPGDSAGAERRAAKRTSLVTQIRTAVGGQILVGYSRDVSAGGLFVETEDPPAKGTELTLRFRLTPDSPIQEARATVVYRLEGEGMGLRFLGLSRELQQAIERFVAQQE